MWEGDTLVEVSFCTSRIFANAVTQPLKSLNAYRRATIAAIVSLLLLTAVNVIAP
ncbi:MAG: hypothetical protein HC780_08390 [Leptolyngbyaceae cyanobacterium CSU_1_3]|nr:hypothetical protein [Leptolyngbyaceae cyanobacterium CSU_1_3]